MNDKLNVLKIGKNYYRLLLLCRTGSNMHNHIDRHPEKYYIIELGQDFLKPVRCQSLFTHNIKDMEDMTRCSWCGRTVKDIRIKDF